jgi:HTH-type transcriptional regulator/antitoxin HigA
MKPTIIQSESDYSAALKQVEALMDAASGSQEEQMLERWTLLIEDYESKHYPVPLPDHV